MDMFIFIGLAPKKVIMLRKLCSLILFVLLPYLARAQVSIGVGGGLNYATADFQPDGLIEVEHATYYFLTFAGRYTFSERWSAALDLEYTQRGYDTGNDSQTTFMAWRVGYFDINPEIEYRFIPCLGIAAGPYLGIKINEAFRFEDEGFSNSAFDLVEDGDLGITGSLRAHFGGLDLFLAYQHGLRNISTLLFTDENGITSGTKQFNRTWQLGVLYFIDL